MSESVSYQMMGTAARSKAHGLFAQTMGNVAAVAAVFALDAYLAVTWAAA